MSVQELFEFMKEHKGEFLIKLSFDEEETYEDGDGCCLSETYQG